MTMELVLLLASVVFGIVQIIVVSHLQSWQRGYRWTAGSREQSAAPLIGLAGRAERALRNYLETFPFFAASNLVAAITNTHDWLALWGAHFYFWGADRLRDTLLGKSASCSFARLECPDAWHLDDCCRAIGKMTYVSRSSPSR
jgi:uncharacterized MAPEG superfamily protein